MTMLAKLMHLVLSARRKVVCRAKASGKSRNCSRETISKVAASIRWRLTPRLPRHQSSTSRLASVQYSKLITTLPVEHFQKALILSSCKFVAVELRSVGLVASWESVSRGGLEELQGA